MINKKRVLLTLIALSVVALIAGAGSGLVGAQMLTEVTYYEEDYENVSHVDQSVYELEQFETWAVSTTRDGNRVYRYELEDGATRWQSGLSERGYAVTILPNGYVAAGDSNGNIEIQDPITGTEMDRISHSNNVYSIESTSDNHFVASDSNGLVKKYNQTGGVVWESDLDELGVRDTDIRTTVIDPNGNAVASGHGGFYKSNATSGEII